MPWYHHTTIYQIYPRSFYDSNDDGVGDIQGIIQKLDYIKNLGFETIWCSPFFKSPQQDFGYDVSDYRDIAAEYGTLDDAIQLIEEVHKRQMRIVFDMVMNHTSVEHPWFQKDLHRENKEDFYIWNDKPNNWKSMTGGSGWQYSTTRKQYYWASFLPFQPDLNYRNPEVKRQMFDNVRFWLDKGVDGFRLDIFNVIYKDSQLRDNPFSWKAVPDEKNPDGFFQQFKYTINQPESFEFAKEIRAVCDEYGEKMLLGEVSGNRKTIRKFLGDEKNDGLGLVFDFEMLPFKFNSKFFRGLIENIESDFPDPFMPVYVFSNHDRRRSIKRLNNDERKAKLLHLLQLTIRGVPCMYYGEEIGMTDARIPCKNGLDPIAQKMKKIPRFLFDLAGETPNRDELRTPMQWNDSRNAGFSSAEKTWLPVNNDFVKVNVKKEIADSESLYNKVAELLAIRSQSSALSQGSLALYEKKLFPKNVLVYKRVLGGEELMVMINMGSKRQQFQIEGTWTKIYQGTGTDIYSMTDNKIQLGSYGSLMLKRVQ